MPATAFRAIPFKKDVANARRFGEDARKYVVALDAEAVRLFSEDYTRVAPSATYRRTGTLGRGWRAPGQLKFGADYGIERRNPVLYSSYVQGPRARQARHMARRGWRSSTEVLRLAEQKVNRRFRKTLFVG